MKNMQKICAALIILMVAVLGNVYAQDSDDIFTVGVLVFNPDVFLDEMTNLGYVEGEDIEYMTVNLEGVEPTETAEQREIQIQAMIDSGDVDVFVVTSDANAIELKEKAGDTLIVFSISDDPVITGVVEDLTAPGGLMTGVVSNQHHPRRLQLLTEIDPSIKKVYYLYYSETAEGEVIYNQVRELGEELGVEVVGAPTVDLESGLEALENTPEDVDWLFITPYVLYGTEFDEAMVAVSQRYQAPIAGYLASPQEGYTIGYGPGFENITRQAAQQVDLIARGAAPADIPVMIAENGLVVNLVNAAVADLEIPVAILRQADVIIRPEDLESQD